MVSRGQNPLPVDRSMLEVNASTFANPRKGFSTWFAALIMPFKVGCLWREVFSDFDRDAALRCIRRVSNLRPAKASPLVQEFVLAM